MVSIEQFIKSCNIDFYITQNISVENNLYTLFFRGAYMKGLIENIKQKLLNANGFVFAGLKEDNYDKKREEIRYHKIEFGDRCFMIKHSWNETPIQPIFTSNSIMIIRTDGVITITTIDDSYPIGTDLYEVYGIPEPNYYSDLSMYERFIKTEVK